MSEHTKGPWEARWSERGQYWFIDHPQQEGSATLTKLNCDEADARLISAAPDLLEALEALLPIAARVIQGTTDGQPMLRQARSAINKATGDAQ